MRSAGKKRPGFGDPTRDAFVVREVSKSTPRGDRVLLEDITLSFYYGYNYFPSFYFQILNYPRNYASIVPRLASWA